MTPMMRVPKISKLDRCYNVDMKNFEEGLIKSLISVGKDLLVIAIIFVLARLAMNIFTRITGKAMKKADTYGDKEKGQQLKTSMTLTHSAYRYGIYALAIILCLKQIGLGDEVSGAVVAAGIGGLVISLGSQSIVKDMIAGLFLMFERQFYVGDYVKIGEYEGTVTSIALRVLYLDCAGKRVIIPNGEIKDVVNYSRGTSLAIINIPVSYEEDIDKAIKVTQTVVDRYYEEKKDILVGDKPIVNGIADFGNDYVKLQVLFKTMPLKHWEVEKGFRLALKKEFDKKKIRFGYQKVLINKKSQ